MYIRHNPTIVFSSCAHLRIAATTTTAIKKSLTEHTDKHISFPSFIIMGYDIHSPVVAQRFNLRIYLVIITAHNGYVPDKSGMWTCINQYASDTHLMFDVALLFKVHRIIIIIILLVIIISSIATVFMFHWKAHVQTQWLADYNLNLLISDYNCVDRGFLYEN